MVCTPLVVGFNCTHQAALPSMVIGYGKINLTFMYAVNEIPCDTTIMNSR